MARIVTVYTPRYRLKRLAEMSLIRWFRMSAALADLGHEVDMASNEWPLWLGRRRIRMGDRLRRVPLRKVRWADYDVVKTCYQHGFDTLAAYGGDGHPFIVSRLAAVVGPKDREDIPFYGAIRERMFETQRRIAERSRWVAVNAPPAAGLWRECFGPLENVLLVPGAADRDIPKLRGDPFPRGGRRPRCLFAGNFYRGKAQRETNRLLVDKFNRLGRLLQDAGCQLYLLGGGYREGLDTGVVSDLGTVSHERSWDYLRHADVGVVLSPGRVILGNESTKIYYYLRVGLPVVSESGFPNDHLIHESGLGFVVPNGDLGAMAGKIAEAAKADWDRDAARCYILERHTWDARATVYHRILRDDFPI